jgi:hypothetical protein
MAQRLYAHLLGSSEEHDIGLNTIVTREPMLQYIIDFLNNLCLKNGVRISVAQSKPDTSFNDFFEQYFVSILPNVLRYKMYCGFIPWVVAKHPKTGDRIPVILPIGSFSWSTEMRIQYIDPCKTRGRRGSNRDPAKRKRDEKSQSNFQSGLQHDDDKDTGTNQNLEQNCACEYSVESKGDLGISSEDIYVINLVDPMLLNGNMVSHAQPSNGGNSSSVGQAQFSPLYVPLQKYLAFDVAHQRRLYADDWNTTARLFTTKTPPTVQNERAGRDEIPYGTTRFQQAQMPEGFFTYDNMKLQFQNTSDIVRDALEQTGGRASEHVPSVYSLPAHYNLVQQPELKPLMDIQMLERQYRSAIAQSLGVPVDLIDCDSGTSKMMSGEDLPFMSEMVKNTCGSLTTLMAKVLLHLYSTIYHNESSRALGPRPPSTVRFMFNAEELYSESMKQREDEMVHLQKSSDSTGKASTGKVSKSSSSGK